MCDWIYDALAEILGQDVSEDLATYILSIENQSDFEEYMKNLLDFTDKNQYNLYENIKSIRFGNSSKSSRKATKDKSKKLPLKEDESQSSSNNEKKKKPKKYTKFQLSELQKGYLKEGRSPCECQATKHKLINNCIECGRVVCEQEGSGPCFFCGSLVCTEEELDVLITNTKQADALYRTLTERKMSEGWKKAMQQRNKMLEFDKTCAQRTKVIDDQHDYFETNSRWSTKIEREEAVKKYTQYFENKHASRLQPKKFTLDLLNHSVTEDSGYTYEEPEDMDSLVKEAAKRSQRAEVDIENVLKSIRESISTLKSKEFGIEEEEEKCSGTESTKQNYIIQDNTYLEMRDLGMCLSMHQPWASLLIYGIKKHEGRTWYTSHRGTLWIAAAGKPADPDDIKECEEFYTKYYEGKTIKFPTEYPTGCLLGRVHVDDCLSQATYRDQYPNGESNSPHVIICSNPAALAVPYAMQGEHKIYKLTTKIHKMAVESLKIQRMR